MWLSSLAKLSAIACVVTFAPVRLFACTCAGIHGKNAWERSQKQVQASAVVFEGILERSELQWSIDSSENPSNWSRIRLTFRVNRAYKGDLSPETVLTTGLGGGDCGATFSPGLIYLVYGGGPSPGGLGVNMCSPGGWIEESTVAPDLRYLRKQPPIASDLELGRILSGKELEAFEKRQQRDLEENEKRRVAATGSICGTVVPEKTKDASGGVISLLSVAGFSPVEHPMANVNPDGSFCSGRLGPGKYYVFFTRTTDGQPTSAVFYPGVNTRSEATAIEIGAGQNHSGLIFKASAQKAYAVRGLVFADDKSALTAGFVRVDLVNLDAPYRAWYHQEVNFQSAFPLPRVKYFTFGDVLPGRYTAYISYPVGLDWSTSKVDVDVTTHMKFFFLDLVHRK
jgi:hypothetical protein